MTRFLSSSLQAQEPFFRAGLQRLEAANGHPNTDIRLTTDILRAANSKLLQLGLDHQDTTAEELYHVLQSTMADNDTILTRRLRTLAASYISAEADVVDGMVHALQSIPDPKRCYAIKTSVMKTILKKLPPKKAMKKLGYRSVDSLLKHETVSTVVAVAWLVEGITWQQKLLDHYKKLRPADFETRNISISQLRCKRWPSLAEDIVDNNKHNLLPIKELGAVVFLPFPAHAPDGAATVSLCLALQAMNDIRATSTFLKLSQVRADFGTVVKQIATGDPQLNSKVLDRPVSWHLVQQYYARMRHHFSESVFEPHVQLEDMVWHPIEQTLARIEPKLKFWENSGHLGTLHDDKTISLNIIDAALNFCNKLPFEKRVTHYFQTSVWHELLIGYMQHGMVEASVLYELQPSLAKELAVI